MLIFIAISLAKYYSYKYENQIWNLKPGCHIKFAQAFSKLHCFYKQWRSTYLKYLFEVLMCVSVYICILRPQRTNRHKNIALNARFTQPVNACVFWFAFF